MLMYSYTPLGFQPVLLCGFTAMEQSMLYRIGSYHNKCIIALAEKMAFSCKTMYETSNLHKLVLFEYIQMEINVIGRKVFWTYKGVELFNMGLDRLNVSVVEFT